LDLTKRDWGELKRLLKGYANGQEPATHERGVESLLYISGKLVIEAARLDWSTIPVRPVG
jgi:hypothetical protein